MTHGVKTLPISSNQYILYATVFQPHNVPTIWGLNLSIYFPILYYKHTPGNII
jgi:hypothetical protein